jgi:N-acetylglutamate synthase-like GNAT family acetyltransferase
LSNHRLSRVPAGSRERFLPLFLLADESAEQVQRYMNTGDLYIYSSEDDIVAGIVLAIPVEPGVVELKAVAIEMQQQRQGIGKRMLIAVLVELRDLGCKRVLVGTANAAIGQLAFYQKAGFRLLSIERDFFSPVRGYAEVIEESGIRMRDMVRMDLILALD